MRKPNSLFDQVCSFINDQPIGSTFKVQDIYNSVDEVYTRWKRSYNDPGYTTRLYCGYLRHAKVLCKYKRGTWTVLAHIPKDISLDKINGNCDYHKRWKANTQVPNDIVSTPVGCAPASQTIIIYKIVDKHVEPSEVLKTQVSALLSTGNYFEDELDAWYFLSIGTGYAVESLKFTWKKTQDFANDIIEFKAQAENTENQNVPEIAESELFDKKYVRLEDIRGREVYVKPSDQWIKGTIRSFQMEATINYEIKYTKVLIDNGVTAQWHEYKTVKMTKEDVIKEFTESLNSL